MNMSDMAPVGGRDLRTPARVSQPAVSEPVGTFTQTASPHPDEIWSPRGSEIAPPDRPLSSTRFDPYQRPGAETERPMAREHVGDEYPFSFHDVARTARAAVRPGTSVGAP